MVCPILILLTVVSPLPPSPLPACCRYAGEQHGFRKAENIEDSLNSELYFYSRVFGFDVLGSDPDIKPFKIDNLSDDAFAAIDADKDGALTKEELKAAFKGK